MEVLYRRKNGVWKFIHQKIPLEALGLIGGDSQIICRVLSRTPLEQRPYLHEVLWLAALDEMNFDGGGITKKVGYEQKGGPEEEIYLIKIVVQERPQRPGHGLQIN